MKIPLTQNKFTIIDDEDFPVVMNYKWYAKKVNKKNKYYVYTNGYNQLGNKKKLMIHRIIMNIQDPNIKIDHINSNSLDNRQCNLRICGHSQNSRNRILNKNNTTGYKGIFYRKSKNWWESHIKYNTKKIHLGVFKTKEEAAEAYNQAAVKYFGEFANLNIIKKVK